MYSLILHGRNLLRLQKCRHLIIPLTLLQNGSAFSTSTSDVISQRKNFTASYLVESLGFTTKLAESISRKVSFEDKSNPDSVLNLLRTHGFVDSQVITIVTLYPKLLVVDVEKTLGPNLKLLQSRGASTSELTKIVSKVPEILGKRRCIGVYYDFVKEIVEADKGSKFQKLSQSLPQQGNVENKLRNLSVLRELGLPQKLLFPLLMSRSSHVCGKEKFEESLKKVLEMGFDPTTSKFVQALQCIQSLKNGSVEESFNAYTRVGFSVEDVWKMFRKWPYFLLYSEKKINLNFETLKKCGLLKDEVLVMVKKFPQCIGISEQKILDSVETFLELGFSKVEFAKMAKSCPPLLGLSADSVKKKTEFVVKQMNWPLKTLAMYPQVLELSLEKRIVPRCNVMIALMSKGLLRSELPPLSSVLLCTNEVFLNKYVRKHNDKELVREMMNIFTGKTGKTY